MKTARNRMGRVARIALAAAVALPFAACDRLREDLLDAPDPDIIQPGTITSPEAADALRVGTVARVRGITGGGEMWLMPGMLVDEWKSSNTFFQHNETDQRTVQESNSVLQGPWRNLHRVRNSAREAINALRTYKPTPAWGIGQMYFAIGLAELYLGENFCNGVPLGDGSTGEAIYGPPLTNAQLYAIAIAHFDSALAQMLPATDANAVKLASTIKIHKARAQVDLGQFTAAVATVNGIATSFVDEIVGFSLTTGDNQIWSLNSSAKRYTVGDSFDVSGLIKNAIPFASLGDSRVKVSGQSINSSIGRGFDNSTSWVRQEIYARSDAAYVANGIDARLIEAEARLQAQDIPGMMTILNTLRGSVQKLAPNYSTTVLAALPTPGSQAEARALFFREKALWQFSRGFRLNDLRRQVRQYGVTQDQVFPTGTFFKTQTPYGDDVNFPVTVDEYNNPEFTGCIDRKA